MTPLAVSRALRFWLILPGRCSSGESRSSPASRRRCAADSRSAKQTCPEVPVDGEVAPLMFARECLARAIR